MFAMTMLQFNLEAVEMPLYLYKLNCKSMSLLECWSRAAGGKVEPSD